MTWPTASQSCFSSRHSQLVILQLQQICLEKYEAVDVAAVPPFEIDFARIPLSKSPTYRHPEYGSNVRTKTKTVTEWSSCPPRHVGSTNGSATRSPRRARALSSIAGTVQSTDLAAATAKKKSMASCSNKLLAIGCADPGGTGVVNILSHSQVQWGKNKNAASLCISLAHGTNDANYK